MVSNIALSWISKICILLIAIGSLVFAHRTVRATAHDVAELRYAIAQQPKQRLALERSRIELARRADDLTSLASIAAPSPEHISDVVSLIAAAGEQVGIAVQVPSVSEDLIVNDKGQPDLPPGPLLDIRLSIEAEGAPDQLLSFLHSLEYTHYALRIPAWHLRILQQPVSPTAKELPSTRASLHASILVPIVKGKNNDTP